MSIARTSAKRHATGTDSDAVIYTAVMERSAVRRARAGGGEACTHGDE